MSQGVDGDPSKEFENLSTAMTSAMSAVRAAPNDADAWEQLDELNANEQRPEAVAALYLELLTGSTVTPTGAEAIGKRAIPFFQEWFEDPTAIAPTLKRVIELSPAADWAFHRLTLSYTHAKRWNELLELYDNALSKTNSPARRGQLLDEAAQLARDFAGDSDRATKYLEQLVELRPADGQLASALERLLERQSRFSELISLWNKRLPVLSDDEAKSTRLRMANCFLDQLKQPEEAIGAVATILDKSPLDSSSCAVVDRVLAGEEFAPEVRRHARAMLLRSYTAETSPDLRADVLSRSRGFIEPNERGGALHELSVLHEQRGRIPEAIDCCAELVIFDPGNDAARARLKALTESVNVQSVYASALTAAATALDDDSPARAATLRTEAAQLFAAVLNDDESATPLFEMVVDASRANAADRLVAARGLDSLYARANRDSELLGALERLALLEDEASRKIEVLVRAAQLAQKLGEVDRSLAAWEATLAIDSSHSAALDATVGLLRANERWAALVVALRRRSLVATDPTLVRADLVDAAQTLSQKLADTSASIALWNDVGSRFGRNDEVVDSLAVLHAQAEQWNSLASLLTQALDEATDTARRAELSAQLGDTLLRHLNQPQQALNRYAATLTLVPSHALATERLKELSENPVTASGAVDALAAAYAALDHWEGLLGLVDARLSHAGDPTTRALILLESASTFERRASDLPGALRSVCRAFVEVPSEADIESHMLRLAAESGDFGSVADAYRSAIETSPELANSLRVKCAATLENRVHNYAEALVLYQEIFSTDPRNTESVAAVVRVAALTGDWGIGAGALVSVAGAGGPTSDALAVYEQSAAKQNAWDLATESLEASLDVAELSGTSAHQLWAAVGYWYRDHQGAPDQAQAAFLRATDASNSNFETLEALAALQRRTPDGALIDTLLLLAKSDDRTVSALAEAGQVAVTSPGDPRQREILQRLYEVSSAAWAAGQTDVSSSADWATENLVRLYSNAGEAAAAVAQLEAAAKLPFESSKSREFRRRAGAIAESPLNDSARALALFKGVFDEDPDDNEAATHLAQLFERRGEHLELLALRSTQKDRATDVDTRADLRIELARVRGMLNDGAGAERELRENLVELPGHSESVTLLAELLESREAFADLVDLYAAQGASLEQAGDTVRAQKLWANAARIAEHTLRDDVRAITAYTRVVGLGASHSALDSLAALHSRRNEHALAVVALEQRLQLTDQADRVGVVAQLTRAYVAAEKTAEATSCLETQLQHTPAESELRALLADRYRVAGKWAALADFLTDSVEFANDDDERVAMLREASEVFVRKLSAPEKAIPVLARAVELAPTDRTVRVALADARCLSGDFDGARLILEALLTEYGRRRPPERAKVHRTLARISRAQGELKAALAQLELASNIDLDDPHTLQMVGEVGWELGEYDRSETAFRSLLLLVRRQETSEDGPGQAEVLFFLHRIAKAQSQTDRASEVLETAFEASHENAIEGRRFEHALNAGGEYELLLRALTDRTSRTQDPATIKALQNETAFALEKLERNDEALTLRIRAMEASVSDPEAHIATRRLAQRVGQPQRYVTALQELALRLRATDPNSGVAGELLLRSGEAAIDDLGDARMAVSDLERAHEFGAPERDVLRALDRAYVKADAQDPLRAVLTRRADPEGPEDSNDERIDALYRLAALDLKDDGRRADGLSMLDRALDQDARYDRAANLLKITCGVAPSDVALVQMYERVARSLGDETVLLDALDRVTALADASQDVFREAVEMAQRLEDRVRERAVLERASERFGDSSDGVWTLVGLARLTAMDNPREGVNLLQRAAKVADASEALGFGIEAAQIAAGPLADLALAASIYETLIEREPTERAVWEPLLQVYRDLGLKQKLADRIATLIDNVYDVAERNRLRIERAKILSERPDGREEATATLRSCLDDDPGAVDAASFLADLLEQSDNPADLDEFLRWQIDAARDRADARTVVALSMRLGARLVLDRGDSTSHREDAIALYRSALDWAPADATILRALLTMYTEESERDERGEILEKLLENTDGDEATNYAMELAANAEARGDQDATIRALTRGFQGNPSHAPLRDKLENLLRAAELTRELAEMLVFDAQHRTAKHEAVARLREAATLYRDTLADSTQVAETLRLATELDPHDTQLVLEYSEALSANGSHEQAAAAVASVIEQLGENHTREPALRRTRAAHLRNSGALKDTVDELELASARDPEGTSGLLFDALEALRMDAIGRHDRAQEREVTERLSAVAMQMGDSGRAASVLEAWIDREPADIDAMRRLATLHADAGRWDDVVSVYQRLVDASPTEEKLDAVLRLAEACERAGRPGDAREGLEQIFQSQPENEPIRAWLRRVYTATEAHSELADLSMEDAKHAPAEAIRFDRLRQAGKLYVLAGRNDDAVPALEAALKLRGGDHESTASLADAYIALGNIDGATGLLQAAIAALRNRRSPELAALQFRMARAALAVGDQGVQLAWLTAALESDHQNGPVASELAELAMAFDDLETAMKALRALTLMKNPGPMTRAQAFYRQGVIAYRQGDPRKAAFLAKRALSEDAELADAKDLLQQLGE